MFPASEHLWMDWDTKAQKLSDFFWGLIYFLDLAARETSWRDPSLFIHKNVGVSLFLFTDRLGGLILASKPSLTAWKGSHCFCLYHGSAPLWVHL